MRQRNQGPFLDLLQRLRIGTCLKSDIEFLNQRRIDPKHSNYLGMHQESERHLHLYPTVKQVDEYNANRLDNLQKLNQKVYKIFARDTYASGSRYGSTVPKELIPNNIKLCAGIASELSLTIGVKLMLRWNIDVLGKSLWYNNNSH